MKGHQAMNDDVKKVVAWLRRTAGGLPHLETLLAHIDGEPARLAAAREEQLAEGIAEGRRLERAAIVADLRAEVVSLRAHQAAIEAALEPSSNIETTLGGRVKALRARVAELEAERDALKSRLYGPLTAEEYARLTALESLTETEARQAMASGVSADKLGTFLGRVYKTVGERDALRAQLLSERERLERWLTAPDGKQYERGTVQAVFDECDALRAQVEAARTYARQSLDYGEDCVAHDLLKAMDEARP